jgi:hypothetical protein
MPICELPSAKEARLDLAAAFRPSFAFGESALKSALLLAPQLAVKS